MVAEKIHMIWQARNQAERQLTIVRPGVVFGKGENGNFTRLYWDVYKRQVNKARKTAIFFYENGSCGRDVLTDFLGDAELKSIMSDGYNAYVFIGNELKLGRFKDTVHQVCMSHAKNKFVKASNQGGEPTAERFSEILKEFFMRDREYDDAGLTPKERFQERQSLETKELLIELRSLLDSEQSKDSEFRSRYYKEALNYLNPPSGFRRSASVEFF